MIILLSLYIQKPTLNLHKYTYNTKATFYPTYFHFNIQISIYIKTKLSLRHCQNKPKDLLVHK